MTNGRITFDQIIYKITTYITDTIQIKRREKSNMK